MISSWRDIPQTLPKPRSLHMAQQTRTVTGSLGTCSPIGREREAQTWPRAPPHHVGTGANSPSPIILPRSPLCPPDPLGFPCKALISPCCQQSKVFREQKRSESQWFPGIFPGRCPRVTAPAHPRAGGLMVSAGHSIYCWSEEGSGL